MCLKCPQADATGLLPSSLPTQLPGRRLAPLPRVGMCMPPGCRQRCPRLRAACCPAAPFPAPLVPSTRQRPSWYGAYLRSCDADLLCPPTSLMPDVPRGASTRSSAQGFGQIFLTQSASNPDGCARGWTQWGRRSRNTLRKFDSGCGLMRSARQWGRAKLVRTDLLRAQLHSPDRPKSDGQPPNRGRRVNCQTRLYACIPLVSFC